MQGFRSRAAYKLLELDQKFRIIGKSTRNVVDLGFAPGAWTQVCLARFKAMQVSSHDVLGIDLIDCAAPEGAAFMQGDVFSKKTHAAILDHFGAGGADLVLSDMMTNTTGTKDQDHFASMDLCAGVMMLTRRVLRRNGNLVMKFYTGAEDAQLQQELESLFHKVHRAKPDACRAELREMYFVALKRRDSPEPEISRGELGEKTDEKNLDSKT